MKIYIVAHPNSKKPRIEKDLMETYHVYVNEPPIGGRANQAIVTALAKYHDVKRSQVILISGEKSKNKEIEINTDKSS